MALFRRWDRSMNPGEEKGTGMRHIRSMALCLMAVFVMSMVAAASAAASGPVVAWGWNEYGQLGNGTTGGYSDVPVAVSGLSGVTAISAGDDHSLVLLSNATVMAWGDNIDGQLGNGTETNSDVPVAVSGLSGVTAISAGSFHSLALLSNGTVMAWGGNELGQLGDGTTGGHIDVPVAVKGLTGVTAVSADGYHSLALLGNGTVMAWGDNEKGELGNGTTGGYSDVPVAVSGLGGVTAVSAGGYHSLALLGNGTAMAWGANEFGELGNGTETFDSDVPVAVSGLSGVTAVAGGGAHSLALLSSGTAMAWGWNAFGQLGNETETNSDVPVEVEGGITAVAGGGDHSLALLSNRTVLAWGANEDGQLGNGTKTFDSDVPVAVKGLIGVTAVSGGGSHSLALLRESRAEYGQCVAQKKGEYTNSTCTTKSAKPKKGTFEWKPGPAPSCVAQKKGEYMEAGCKTKSVKPKKGKYEKAPGAGFTLEANTTTVGEVGGYPRVVCTHLSAPGEVTGAKTGTVQLTFTGCEAGGHHCTSSGQAPGTIQTPLLDTNLVEPNAGEVLTQFISKAGPTGYSYEFTCETLAAVRVAGADAGVTTGDINLMGKTNAVEVANGKGEQGLLTELNGGGGWIGPLATTAEATVTTTFASEMEIRT